MTSDRGDTLLKTQDIRDPPQKLYLVSLGPGEQ